MNTRAMGSSSRLTRRLLVFVWAALLVGAAGARATPVKTLVQDTLYRADGSVAQGSVTIRWSGFSTGAGEAVAAGELTVTTDAAGGVSIPLIPNTGSSPSGSYYKVVIKLSDGTSSEEQWVVPATATTTIATIRAKVVPQAVAAQFVSRDYVDSALSKLPATNPPVNTDWNSTSGPSQILNKPVLAAVASSGNYNDLKNTPPIPNLAAPGAIGTVTPGMINSAGYEVSGTPLASTHLSDSANLVRNTSSYTNPGWLTGLDGSKITGGLNNVSIGATTPNMVNATNVTAQNIVTSHSPVADIRAYGAKCDGVTDDTAALQAAITAAGVGGGTVLVPGLGSGCYIANPTLLAWPTLTGTLALNLQGKLITGSTLTLPDWVDIIGQGGANGVQFHGVGPTAKIQGPSTTGTLGTAVTTGSAQTFTPSTMTGIYPGTVMTVVGQATCTITSISRAANVVTATLSGACHVAAGFYATVAGVTDSSYNGTNFVVNSSDYVANTLRWQQTGANSSSTGGTLAGVNEDSIETAIITATTSTTATASFVVPHSATDKWGIAGIYLTGWQHHTLNNLTLSASGTALWAYHAANIHLNGVSMQVLSSPSQDMEFNESNYIYIHDSAGMFAVGQASWSIRFTNMNLSTQTGGGLAYIDNSLLLGGIKLDRGSSFGQGSVHLTNTIIERPSRGGFTVDPTGSWVSILSMDKVFLQDNFNGYSPCYVYYLYPNPSGVANLRGIDTAGTGCITNSYYNGALELDAVNGPTQLGGNRAYGFTLSAGRALETELRGSGANLSPSLIPFATLPVPDMSTWVGTGSCSITSGVTGPDGAASAYTFTGTGGGNVLVPYRYSYTPAVGDWVLYGGWVKAPDGNLAQGYNTISIGVYNDNAGAAYTFDQGDGVPSVFASTFNFDTQIYNDWWHPVVGATQITVADGSVHNLDMEIGCQNGGGISLYNPWMMLVPASANVPRNEIQRWRQQLLHGYVPSGVPASVLAVNPILKMYWGNDTTLYRGAAGVVKTDGTFNAVSGYQVNGAALNFSNLAGAAAAAQLPTPTSSAIGAVKSVDCSTSGSSYFVQKINTDGSETCVALSGAGTGNVSGPGSSTINDLATYNATNGQTIKDSGVLLSTVRTTAGGQTITAADTVSGMPSGCTQYPCVVASQAPSTSTSTGDVTNAILNTPPAGLYRLCGYAEVTVAGTAGSFYLGGSFTSGGGHYTATGFSAAIAASTQWSAATQCWTITASSATQISFQLHASGVTGTPSVRWAGTLERLQ